MLDTKTENENNFISLAEASQKTGYHQDYLGFLCRTGKLQGFKIGRNWVITKPALEAFLQTAHPSLNGSHAVSVNVINNDPLTQVPLTSAMDLEKTKTNADLTNLKRRVFEDLDSKVLGMSQRLNELDMQLEEMNKISLLKASQATLYTPQPTIPNLAEIKKEPEILKNNFSSNFSATVADDIEPLVKEKSFSPLAVLSPDNLFKLKESFKIATKSSLLAPSLAGAIAILGFVSTVAWNYVNEDLYRNYQTPAVVYKNNFRPEDKTGTTTPPVIIPNGNQIVIRDRFTTETVVKSLSVDASLVNQLIDQRLNKYLAEGKFKGEKGEAGAQGLQGGNGQAVGPGGYVPYAYYQPVPANNFTGGTSLSSTQLSANSGVITTLSVGDITTTGNATIGGTLNVSGNTGLSTANISTLNVAGTSNLATTTISQLNVSGNATTTGNLAVLGTLSLSGSLSSASGTFNSLIVNGNATTTGNSVVSGNQLVSGTLSVVSTTTLATTTLSVLTASGNVNFQSALTVVGTSTLATTSLTALSASGNLSVVGTSTLATTTITNLSVSGNSTYTGNLTLATMTPGSIIFAGVGGVLNQNNSNFFWDNTNKYFNLGTNTVASTLAIQGTGATNPFSISSSTGATLLNLLPNGNVGIGESAPGSKLSVSGGATIGASYDTTVAPTNGLLIEGNVGIGTTASTAKLNIVSATTDATIYNPSSGVGIILRGLTAANTGQLRIVPNTGAWADGAATTYFQMTNTTNNNATFMGGTYGTDTQLTRLQFNSLLTTVTDITYTTTPVPTALFEIINSTASKVALKVRGATSQSGDYVNINSVSGSGGDIFVIESSGNTGIATTTPVAKLAVVGTAGANAILDIASSTSTSVLRIAPSGNVGIGTTTPTQKLHVAGSTLISNTADTATALLVSGTSKGVRIGSTASLGTVEAVDNSGVDSYQPLFLNGSNIQFGNSGTEYMRLTGGNVGIGTSSPASKLHIEDTAPELRVVSSNSSGDPSLLLARAVSPTGIGVKLWYDNSEGDAYLDNLYNSDGGDIYFRTKTAGTAVNALSILGGGNVGIGTTTPSSKLQVVGDIQLGSVANASSANLIFNTGSTTNQSVIRLLATTTLSSSYIITLPTTTPSAGKALFTDASGSLYWSTSNGGSGTNGYTARWSAADTLTTGVLIDNGTVAGVNASSSTTSLWVQGTGGLNPFAVASSTGTQLLTILPNGNLGIGDTTPDYLFGVGGSAGFDGLVTLTGSSANIALGSNYLSGDGGDEGIAVDSSGRVAIGASTQVSSKLLTISDVASASTYTQAGAQGIQVVVDAGGGIYFSDVGGPYGKYEAYDGQIGVGSMNSYPLGFWTNNSEVGRFDTSGRLGVNDTSPDFRLESVGSSGSGYFGITNSTDGDIFKIDSSGNIGIGTTTPIASLQITGSAINEVGSANSITRGIYVSPNPTNSVNSLQAVDYRGLETSAYTLVLASTTAISQTYSALFNQQIVNTTTVATLANASNVYINGAPKSTSNLTISSSTALTVIGGAVSTTTTAYGLWLNAPTGASSNYAAIFNGGNVGIGIVTPQATLDVAGNVHLSDGSTVYGEGTTYIRAGISSKLHLGSYGSNSQMVINNGNVGIGTVTPVTTFAVTGNSVVTGNSTTTSLAVSGSVNSNLIPSMNNTYSLGSASFYWSNAYVNSLNVNTFSAASTTISGTGSNDFTINTDNATADTEDMNLIFFRGSSSPNAVLTWNSSTKRFEFNQAGFFQNASNTTTQTTLLAKGNSGQTVDIFQVASSSGSTYFSVRPSGDVSVATLTLGSILFAGPAGIINQNNPKLFWDNSNYRLGIGSGTPSTTLAVKGLEGANDILDLASSTSTSVLRVTAAGNVGIGTTTPIAKLALQGTAGANAILDLASSTGTSVLRVLPSGNVGVGTTAPGYNLHVVGGAVDSSLFNVSDDTYERINVGTSISLTPYPSGGTSVSLFAYNNSGTSRNMVQALSSGSGEPVLALAQTTGNVGVGTTTPIAKLSLQGTAGANAILDISSSTSTSVMRIDPAGNIGIGTTTPGRTLSVVGDIRATGILYDSSNSAGTNGQFLMTTATGYAWTATSTLFGGSAFVQNGNSFGTGAILGTNDNNVLSFETNNTTRMNLDTSGNLQVGLNNSTGDAYIDVATSRSGSGYSYVDLIGDTTYTDYGFRILRGNGGPNAISQIAHRGTGEFILNAVETAPIAFYTTNTERMRLTSGGNLGIATTTPTNILHIGGATNKSLRVDSTANAGYFGAWTDGAFMSVNRDDATGNFTNASKAAASIWAQSDTSESYIQFKTTTTNNANPNERMRITGAGNVGIGTTTPTAKLSITGSTNGIHLGEWTTSSAYNALYLNNSPTVGNSYNLLSDGGSLFVNANGSGDIKFREDNNDLMIITNGGNVGIGTTSPTHLLHLENATSPTIKVTDTTQGTTLLMGSQDSSAYLGTFSNHPLGIYTNSGEKIRVDTSGNVGIGTTTPQFKLSVETVGNTYGFVTGQAGSATGKILALGYFLTGDYGIIEALHQGTTYKNLAISPNGGNVGIGTTTPNSKLEVVGASNDDILIIRNSTDNGFLDLTYDSGNDRARVRALNQSGGGQPVYINEALHVGYGGNVGVGTTTSLAKLAVVGTAGANAILDIASSTSTSVMRITPAGNVGIGIVSPTEKLQVVGTVLLTQGSDKYGFVNDSTNYYIGGGVDSTSGIPLHSYYGWTIRGGSGTGLRVDANSYVGVGTTTPATVLEVQRATATYWGQTTAGTWGGSTAPAHALALTNSYAGGYDSTLVFRQTTSANVQKTSGAINMLGTGNWTSTSTQVSDMLFVTRDSSDTLQERMRITSGGRVGIGETSPGAKLHITGSAPDISLTESSVRTWTIRAGGAASGIFDIADLTAAVSRLQINSSGNVGISNSTLTNLFSVGTQSAQSNANISARAGNANSLEWGHANTAGYGHTLGYESSSGAGYLGFMSEAGTTANTYRTRGNKGTVIRGDSSGNLTFNSATTTSADNLSLVENVRIDASGLVGIGINAPSANLDVYKSQGASTGIYLRNPSTSSGADARFRVQADSSYADLVAFNIGGGGGGGVNLIASSTALYIQQIGNSPIVFLTNNTNRGTIEGAGNFGIGNTSPANRLHISDTSTAYTSFTGTSVNQVHIQGTGTSNHYIGLTLGTGSASPQAKIASKTTGSGSILSFGTSNSYVSGITNEAMAIDYNGNIMMGTSTLFRSHKLQVVADNATEPTLGTGSGSVAILGSTGLFGLFMGSNGGTGATWLQSMRNDSATAYALNLQPSGGNVGIGTATPLNTLQIGGTIYNGNEFAIGDGTRNFAIDIDSNGANFYSSSNLILASGGAEKVRVTTAGNVGIGTTAPIAKLAIQGTAGANALLDIASSTSTSILRVSHNGNVGIGTTSPAGTLAISDSVSSSGYSLVINTYYKFRGDGEFTWGANTAQGLLSWDAGRAIIGGQASNDAALYAGGTEKMRITTGGNVGIGTTTPIAKLAVVGTAGANHILDLASSTSTSVFRVTATGNVGIGSTTPLSKLHVGSDSTAYTSTGTMRVANNEQEALGISGDAAGVNINLFVNGTTARKATIQGGGYGSQGGQLVFYTKPDSGSDVSSRMTILGDGTVGIAMSNPSVALDVTGDIEYTGTITDVSDERLKENFVSLTNNLTNLAMLSPLSFNMIGDSRTQLGFTAQNAQAVFPNTVSIIDPSNGYLGLDYTQLIAPAIGAINELNLRTQGMQTFGGNVGIGSPSPTSKLDIWGNLNVGSSTASSLYVNALAGNVGLGTTTPNSKLSVIGDVYIEGEIITGGGADLAEKYPTNEVLEAGDVVMADGSSPVFVRKARINTDSQELNIDSNNLQPITYNLTPILGVVSTKPGLTLNGYRTSFNSSTTVPVALNGRVPVKVTNENGNVGIGDYLTLSKTFPGYAMKATYSGEVIGQALENYPQINPDTGQPISTDFTSGPTAGKILVFMSLGFRNINNTFVLGEDDGQLANATSTLPLFQRGGGGSSFLIDQRGSGNILQLQTNGQDRFLVASSGAVSILANADCALSLFFNEGRVGERLCPVLTVSNASSTLFTINAKGDAQFTGNIIVSKNTAGTAVVKEGDNLVRITFEHPYTTVPKVIVSANAVPNFFYGVVDKSETGFTIQLSQQVETDFSFDWIALVQPEDTQHQSGISFIAQPSSPPTSSPPPAGDNPPAEEPPVEESPASDEPPAEEPPPASSPPSEEVPTGDSGEVAGTTTGQ